MAKTIRIFNPKERPYGQLSNNSTSYFELGNKKWKTVTHYTYSNLLHFPTFKELVRNQAKVRDVYPLFLNLYRQEIHDVTVSAVREATKEKFKNPQLAALLSETAGFDIIYLSDNPVLGARMEGEKLAGENVVGRALMSLRGTKEFKEQKTERNEAEKMDDKIYKIYKAYQVLEDFVNQTSSDVVQFEGASYDEIINSRPSTKFVDKKIVIDLYNRGSFPIVREEFENPGNLIPLFRKEYIDRINQRIKLSRHNIILRMYLDYILKKAVLGAKKEIDEGKGTKMDKLYSELGEGGSDTLRTEALSYLNTNQIVGLRERVVYLFEKGMLSSTLSDEIDRVITKVRPYSEEETKEIKNYQTVRSEKEGPESKGAGEAIHNRVIYIHERLEQNPPELRPFSPYAFTPVEIFALNFPTVMHYIYAKLLSILRQFGTLDRAYYGTIVLNREELLRNLEEGQKRPETVFRDIPSLHRAYEMEKDQEYVEGVEGFTVLGMDKKFARNFSLQDLLLSTEGNKIVYTDRDPILGSGTREEPGRNLVGKYLMEIRTRIFKERETSGVRKIKAEEISEIILNDPQLREWMEGRLAEVCQTMSLVRDYISRKYEFTYDLEITPNFVLILIQTFYPSCFNIYGLSPETEPPKEFVGLLSLCPGLDLFKVRARGWKGMDFDDSKEGLVKVFWNYFTSMFYGMMRINPDMDRIQLRKTMAMAEIRLSKERICRPVILEDQKQNCVLSALLNIMKGLKEASEKYFAGYFLSELDIWAAVKILLNSHLKVPDNLPSNSVTEIETENVLAELKSIDPSVGGPMAKYLLGVIRFVEDYKGLPKNTKRNRVNFFAN